MRILVVEDEAAIADFVVRGLKTEGHQVEAVGDGTAALERALEPEIDLVVLDRMLPGLDGLEVMRALRAARPALPVIMLTARVEVSDRVEGLDAGATDYLLKPFAFDELAARVRAHLRSPATTEPTSISAGGIELELLSRQVTRDGRVVHLSVKEFELLAHFVRNAGRVLSRAQLLAAVWGYDHEPGTNIVEVYISYLRRKLGTDEAGRSPITTVRSAGYRLRSDA